MSQPAKNVIHSDSHPPKTGFAVPFVSLDRNARVDSRHDSIMAQSVIIGE
jgi:hypothetical protein